MTTLMQRAAAFLGDKLQDTAGRTISYQQRGATALEIVAPVSQQDYAVRDEDGIVIGSVTSFDWTIVAADLEDLEPRNGDLITETINGAEATYEVMPVENRKCAEWLDTSGVLLTVHSKKIR